MCVCADLCVLMCIYVCAVACSGEVFGASVWVESGGAAHPGVDGAADHGSGQAEPSSCRSRGQAGEDF